MGIVTVESAEPREDLRLVICHIVIDPHPPSGVEAGDGPGQVLEQLSVSCSRLVVGSPVGLQFSSR